MKVLSAVPWLLGGLVGSGFVLAPQVARSESVENNFQIAQQIVEGLPPPPSVFDQGSAPASMPQPSASYSSQQYWVVVNGDSPLLLSQVQAVVPNASVQDYNGQRLINAGIFTDPAQAQQQASVLASQGISAEIFTIGATPTANSMSVPQTATASTMSPPDLLPVAPVAREVEFGQPPSSEQLSNPFPSGEAESSFTPPVDPGSFYVVIPGKSDELEAITNQVIRLGEGYGIAGVVQASERPRGPHVRIGPFVDRDAATRWSQYFRDFGMNARIYYGR